MLKRTLATALLLASTNLFSLTMTTTIYPLYSITRELGGDKIKLQNLIPFVIEAHVFDPNPSDMAKLSKSDIFITSSDAMEPWKDKIVKSLENAYNLQDQRLTNLKLGFKEDERDYSTVEYILKNLGLKK